MSRRAVLALVVASSLLALDAAPAVAQTNDPLVNPTRLLVKLRPGATRLEIAAAHARAGGVVVKDLPQIGWQIVAVQPGRNLAVQAAYASEPAIERADLDRAHRLAYVPNDPYWPYEWHMVSITADQAWDTIKGDPAVKVAIMDTGIQTDHPDLQTNVWTNPGEIAGNNLDDDGNGYVDDVHGYDFAYNDSNPDDVFGHGTACSGLVASVQDNSIGTTGVAPLCELVAVKAANDSGYFYDSANVPAFLYCADMGFKVISMSFFSDQVTPSERDAVDYCWSKGMVLVAAAGNDSSVLPYYPGAYDHVIGVAALDGSDNRTWFSNYGSWVDVAAPGLSLATTVPVSSYTTGFAGTSGACPHVAGLAALLFSAKPGASNAEVRAALEDTAHSTIDPTLGEYTGYGKIDCKAAVDRLLSGSSQSKPARFLFAAPVAGDPNAFQSMQLAQRTRPIVEFQGVGFESPNKIEVRRDGQPLRIVRQERTAIDAQLAEMPGRGMGSAGATESLELRVNGASLAKLLWDRGPGLVYAPSDVGTFGATITGGFRELYRPDGNVMTCDDNGSGSIYVQIAVREIRPRHPSKITLEFTRAYDNSVGATEQVYVYDWSTWSYPYGTWYLLSSQTIANSAMQTVTSSITVNPDHYLDDSGTMYLYLSTSGVSTSALLRADAFRLRLE